MKHRTIVVCYLGRVIKWISCNIIRIDNCFALIVSTTMIRIRPTWQLCIFRLIFRERMIVFFGRIYIFFFFTTPSLYITDYTVERQA